MKKTRKLFIGRIDQNSGPANVNYNYHKFLVNEIRFIDTSKKSAVIKILFFSLFSKKIIVSGLSRWIQIILLFKKFFKKEVFYLAHGYLHYENSINNIDNETNDKFLKLENIIFSQCDLVIAVSKEFANFLHSQFPLQKYKITYNFNGSTLLLNNDLHDKKLKRIISIGGSQKRKNNLTVCKAIDMLNDSQIEFIIIGDKTGDYEEIIKYPFVKHLGILTHEEVKREMEKSELYIQNSIFETFGLAIIEGVQAKCKILISKKCGVKDVLLGIDESNLISDSFDVTEISTKISQALAKRSESIVVDETCSWQQASNKLLAILEGESIENL